MSLEDYLQHSKKTHLIFDFDETLFRLILPWGRWLDKIENKLVLLDKLILEDYKNKKITLSDLQNKYILTFGNKAKRLIYKNNIEFETKNLKGIEVNEELVEFVKNNKEYKIYIWSSNTSLSIINVFKKHNLLNRFSKIVTRLDLVLIKPDIEGFKKIYDSSIPKKQYLMAGDSNLDKLAAKKAGIDFYKIGYFKDKKSN